MTECEHEIWEQEDGSYKCSKCDIIKFKNAAEKFDAIQRNVMGVDRPKPWYMR